MADVLRRRAAACPDDPGPGIEGDLRVFIHDLRMGRIVKLGSMELGYSAVALSDDDEFGVAGCYLRCRQIASPGPSPQFAPIAAGEPEAFCHHSARAAGATPIMVWPLAAANNKTAAAKPSG